MIFLPFIVPYANGPAVNFLNSMILQVNVPVLSEKMYSTCPSSSFRLEEFTPAGMFYAISYMSAS